MNLLRNPHEFALGETNSGLIVQFQSQPIFAKSLKKLDVVREKGADLGTQPDDYESIFFKNRVYLRVNLKHVTYA